MILTYKDHLGIEKIEKLLKTAPVTDVEKGSDYKAERQILDALRPFRYKEIGEKLLNKIRGHFLDNDKYTESSYEFHKDWYIGEPFKSFMDFFTRKLSIKKYKEIDNKASKCSMIIPNESFIEGIGDFKETKKIVRLKKGGPAIIKELKKFDIDVSNYHYIDMKLFVTFYHRVHMPVKGKITKMIPIEGEDDFFGDNSLWILEIETKKSPVYLMVVGESTIQDYKSLKDKGDFVNIFDTIGYFTWGSQTILLYKDSEYTDIQIKENTTYFPGDCIFK